MNTAKTPDPVRFTETLYLKHGLIAEVNAVVTDAQWAGIEVDSVVHFDDYAKIDVARTVTTGDVKYAKTLFDEAVQTLWRLHGSLTIDAPPAMP